MADDDPLGISPQRKPQVQKIVISSWLTIDELNEFDELAALYRTTRSSLLRALIHHALAKFRASKPQP